MDFDWRGLVKTVAPWIGTALGGPLGGMALSAVADVFGISEKSMDGVKAAVMGATPDQMLALKKADQDFAVAMQKMGFDHIEKLEELDFKDRDSARRREMEVKDNTNKVLAYTVVGAFIAMVMGTLLGWAKVDSVLAGTLVGYLSAKCEQVLAYYFGSTSGSARKTELLSKTNKG